MSKTLTLQINEQYLEKFMTLLDLFPKKMVKIVDEKKVNELNFHKKNIIQSLKDIEEGRTQKVMTL